MDPRANPMGDDGGDGKQVVPSPDVGGGAAGDGLPTQPLLLTQGQDSGKIQEEEEEEYVFEDDEEAIQLQSRWLAIAWYYSGKPYSTWGMFNELSAVWG